MPCRTPNNSTPSQQSVKFEAVTNADPMKIKYKETSCGGLAVNVIEC
ncbi:hypothetical protein [Kitasatospora purpeofusca]